MRSTTFGKLPSESINQIITEFQPFFVKDKTVIDNKDGFIICL